MRLIDADALFKAFEGAMWYDNMDRDDVAEDLLLNAPTVEPLPNGPLTVDELLDMKGEPVWWESKDGRCGWGLIRIIHELHMPNIELVSVFVCNINEWFCISTMEDGKIQGVSSTMCYRRKLDAKENA